MSDESETRTCPRTRKASEGSEENEKRETKGRTYLNGKIPEKKQKAVDLPHKFMRVCVCGRNFGAEIRAMCGRFNSLFT